MQIRFLADAPEHAAQLADWHHAQWHHLYDDWTPEVALSELIGQAQGRTSPTTLVLLENDALLGSVSLVDVDAEALSPIGKPWLASLYVRPEARGKGFGKRLVKALMQHAENISLKEVFLFTPEHKSFYQQLGWSAFLATRLNGQPVDVMRYRIAGSIT